jgi:S-phase kinase-associated protein 1
MIFQLETGHFRILLYFIFYYLREMTSMQVIADIVGLDIELESKEIVTLISKDGRAFHLQKNQVSLSGMLSSVVNCDHDVSTVDLNQVEGQTLELVVQFLEHHNGVVPADIKKPVKAANLSEIVTSWDASFINTLTFPQLRTLILAANYLEIQSLLEICCAKVAITLGKKPTSESALNLASKMVGGM